MTARFVTLAALLAIAAPTLARSAGRVEETTQAQPQAPRPAPRPVAPVEPAAAPAAPAPPAVPAPPAPPAPARPPRPEGQPVNVRVELTIAEQRGTAAPVKKTLMAVVADGHSGSVRSTANFLLLGSVPLNLDTSPEILSDGKIRLRFALQYDLPGTPNTGPEPESREPRTTQIRESVTLILENGKPIVAAQSADPVGDRQVTVEVKATIMR